MAENYWIVLLLFSIIFVGSSIDIWMGHDFRGSEKLRKKFALKSKLAQKIVILKPMDKKEISVLEFLPYFVSIIHLLILFPVHIIYWISENDFLSGVLKGNPYKIYTIIILIVMFVFIITIRIIDLFLGQKERHNK